MFVAPVSLPGAERLRVPREGTPPRPGVITGEDAVIAPAGTLPRQRDLYPPETEQQDETRASGEQDEVPFFGLHVSCDLR